MILDLNYNNNYLYKKKIIILQYKQLITKIQEFIHFKLLELKY